MFNKIYIFISFQHNNYVDRDIAPSFIHFHSFLLHTICHCRIYLTHSLVYDCCYRKRTAVILAFNFFWCLYIFELFFQSLFLFWWQKLIEILELVIFFTNSVLINSSKYFISDRNYHLNTFVLIKIPIHTHRQTGSKTESYKHIFCF